MGDSSSELDDPISAPVLPLNRSQRKNRRKDYNMQWKKKNREKRRKVKYSNDFLQHLSSEEESDTSSMPTSIPSAILTGNRYLDSEDEFFIHRIEQVIDLNAESRVSEREESDTESDREIDMSYEAAKKEDLQEYVQSSNLLTTQTEELLAFLNRHKDIIHADIPQSYKTLLRTTGNPVKNDIREVSGHSYYYIGLERQLRFYLPKYPEDEKENVDFLQLIWNVDGIEIFKSRRLCSWAFLCTISNLRPRVVFEVAITLGCGKPANLDFMQEFISELKQLMVSGIQVDQKKYAIKIKACVCDAPARAMVKQIKQFSAKFGCDFCMKEGIHDGKRTVWTGSQECIPRTDENFRNRKQPLHHKINPCATSVEELPIDMISVFPPDFMHQGGGTMKKMLLWLLKGPKKAATEDIL